MPERRTARLAATLLAGALSAVVLTGCAASGTSPLQQATLEDELVKQLGEVGYTVDDVTCPGDLESEKGAKTTCELSESGHTVKVAVTVTDVKNGTVYFDAVPDADHSHDEAPAPSESPSESTSESPSGSPSE